MGDIQRENIEKVRNMYYSEEVVEIAMYKMIFARTDMPNELRKEAEKWLHDRGYNAAILMLPKKR
jgi:hypothetical protein